MVGAGFFVVKEVSGSDVNSEVREQKPEGRLYEKGKSHLFVP